MTRPGIALMAAEPGGERAAIQALALQYGELLAALRELRDQNREQERRIATLERMAGVR